MGRERDLSTTLDARARGRTKLSSPVHFPEDLGLSPACSYHAPNTSSLLYPSCWLLTHWSPPFNVASRKDHSTPPPSKSLFVPVQLFGSGKSFCSSHFLLIYCLLLPLG